MILNRAAAEFFSIKRFVVFVFLNFPIAYMTLLLMALGVVFEYLTLSLMIPLGGGGQGVSIQIAKVWRQIVENIGLPDEARVWLWLFMLFLFLRILIGLIQVVLNAKVAKLIHLKLSSETFGRVVSEVPMQDIYRQSIGHYMALAGDDSIRVGQLFFSFLQIFTALSSAAIGMLALYLYSEDAFLIVAAFIFCSALVLSSLMKKILTLSAASREQSKETVSVFVEVLNGLRSIRSMAAEGYVNSRYREALYRYTKMLFQIDSYNHAARTLPGLFLIGVGLILLFPGLDVSANFSVLYFFTVILIVIRVLSFLGVAVFSAGRIVADIVAIQDLGHIINLPKSASLADKKIIVKKVDEINFFNLTCGYGSNFNVIKDITGKFRVGKVYAVTGGSGAGKSTLSDVLLGLLPPVLGRLSIDGVLYSDIDPLSLRRKVILVEQQTKIFSGSIRENIEFGLIATDKDVIAAGKVAGLDEFIDELSEGLNTKLEYQGANISGGQRQRIGLARAILREPDVLILDEATSALDSQTRDQVLASLFEKFKDKILIFITHDLKISGSADEVWNLKGGRLSIYKNPSDGAVA